MIGSNLSQQNTISIASALIRLASVCDGARARDGRGFSRAHAHTGARLAAMVKAGIPFSSEDMVAARNIAKDYAPQAGGLFSPNDETKANNISRLLCSERTQIGHTFDPKAGECPYAILSHGQRNVYVYIDGRPASFLQIVDTLKGANLLEHGERRVRAVLADSKPYRVNGKLKKGKRWEVSFNSTTRPIFHRLQQEFGVAVDPATLRHIDREHDHLLKFANAAYMQDRTTDNGRKWYLVFDLDRPNKEFIEDVKTRLAGNFEFSPADDSNWSVPLTRQTMPTLVDLIVKYNFATCRRTTDFFKLGNNPSPHRTAM